MRQRSQSIDESLHEVRTVASYLREVAVDLKECDIPTLQLNDAIAMLDKFADAVDAVEDRAKLAKPCPPNTAVGTPMECHNASICPVCIDRKLAAKGDDLTPPTGTADPKTAEAISEALASFDDDDAPCIHCGAYGGDHDLGCSYHPDMMSEAGPGAPAPQKRTGSCKACGQADDLHRVEDDCVLCPPPANAVHVDDREYQFAHGKAPHGRGNWCFHLLNGQGNTVADVWHNGTYTEARKEAVSRARFAGVVDVVVGS